VSEQNSGKECQDLVVVILLAKSAEMLEDNLTTRQSLDSKPADKDFIARFRIIRLFTGFRIATNRRFVKIISHSSTALAVWTILGRDLPQQLA